MNSMYLSSVKLFYDESVESKKQVQTILLNYRTNTTTIIGVATGAAAFFGFSDSQKGPLFTAALICYAVAALLALSIYIPVGLTINVAYNMKKVLDEASTAYSPIQSYYDLATAHQIAVASAVGKIKGWKGLAARFCLLMAFVAATVVLAGFNLVGPQDPKEVPPPTHIVIDSPAGPSN